jgi:hypothetical protein
MGDLVLFQIDKRELKQLELFMKRAPRRFHRAVANMLNDFAFGTRTESLEIINRRLTVRSPRFIAGSVRVTKARGGQPMNMQRAITGSIARPRFSGLVEQETGAGTMRTRTATLLARAGSKSKRIQPSVRLKSANQFVSYHDYPGRDAAHRTIVMLQSLFRERYRRPFLVTRHRKFKRGLYRIRGGNLKMVQSFEPETIQPRRVRWLSGGRKQFFAHANIRLLWAKNLERELRKMKR